MLRQSLSNIIKLLINDTALKHKYIQRLQQNIDYSLSLEADFIKLLTPKFLRPIHDKDSLNEALRYFLDFYPTAYTDTHTPADVRSMLIQFDKIGYVAFILIGNSDICLGAIFSEYWNAFKVFCEDTTFETYKLN